MGSISRWRSAQQAEASYEHFDTPGQGVLDDIRDRFGLASDAFAGQAALEVGAGNGPVYQIDEARWRVGIDPLSRRKSEALGSVARREGNLVVAGVGEHLPFVDDSFATVICYNVLDHVHDPLRTLEEMARVLEPGGTLYLVVHTFRGPKAVRELITYFDRPHPHRFSDSEVTTLLTDAGLDLVGKQSSPPEHFPEDSVKWRVATSVFDITDTYYEATPRTA